MKINFKLIGIALTIMTFTSCLVDDDPRFVTDQGPNLVGFTRASMNASLVADGEDKIVNIPVQLTGPTSKEFTGDITATVEVDPSSTAVEGVHYLLTDNTIELNEENNFIDILPVTVITEGVEPPLNPNPVLKLKITEVNGESVVSNGRTDEIAITLEFLCYSQITGAYETLDAEYWRLGVFTYDEGVWPAEMEILYICNDTFRVIEWLGPFNGNEWYFKVDDEGNITYPATKPNGAPQKLNDQPLITCESDPGNMSSVPCGESTNYVEINGEEVILHMSVGYLTPGSGPREFYQVLKKIN